MTSATVEVLHAEQIREHGGQAGVRDPGLLESAVARPRHQWSYGTTADLAGVAAEYGFGIAKNHPFLDGNKRVAFAATNVFLLMNGWEIETPEPAVVDVMLRVADGRMDRDGLAAWLRSVLVPFVD
ncbi:MAG: type II toxin-antitoxin system death-on-curing family toxin [Gemmatimonadota bacterium]